MKIFILAATPFEIAPLLVKLENEFYASAPYFFTKGELSIKVGISGIGMVATTFHLLKNIQKERFDFVINAGIAGSFSGKIGIGEVVNVATERFGDLGVENADGKFEDSFELGLSNKNEIPFEQGILKNHSVGPFQFLKTVNGLTVNKVHGTQSSIQAIKSKYPEVEIETMEGAAFFYTCLLEKLNFVEIRAISNFVEPRNKENWNIPLAIGNLNAVLAQIIDSIQ